MNCSNCQCEFDALLDGQLAGDAEAVVRQHLANCPDCDAAWRDCEAAWKAFASAPDLEPSSNFVVRVMNAVAAAENSPAPRWLPGWLWPLPRFATIAATAAVLFSIGFGYYRLNSNQVSYRDLLAEMPVVQHFDLLRDMDVITNLDELVPQSDEIDSLMNEVWSS